MKIRPLKRFLQDDYPGSQQWFWGFLGNLNQMIDTLNPLIQNGIDIDNNLMAERQTVTLAHNTPKAIKLQKLQVTPKVVRLGYAAGLPGIAYISGYNKDGTVSVGVYFLGTAPTSAVSCVLVFEP